MSAIAPTTQAMSSPVQTQTPARPSSANGMNATANGGGYRKIANPPATIDGRVVERLAIEQALRGLDVRLVVVARAVSSALTRMARVVATKTTMATGGRNARARVTSGADPPDAPVQQPDADQVPRDGEAQAQAGMHPRAAPVGPADRHDGDPVAAPPGEVDQLDVEHDALDPLGFEEVVRGRRVGSP